MSTGFIVGVRVGKIITFYPFKSRKKAQEFAETIKSEACHVTMSQERVTYEEFI